MTVDSQVNELMLQRREHMSNEGDKKRTMSDQLCLKHAPDVFSALLPMNEHSLSIDRVFLSASLFLLHLKLDPLLYFPYS